MLESKDIWMTNIQFFKVSYKSIRGKESTDGCWYLILETWWPLASDSGNLMAVGIRFWKPMTATGTSSISEYWIPTSFVLIFISWIIKCNCKLCHVHRWIFFLSCLCAKTSMEIKLGHHLPQNNTQNIKIKTHHIH